MGFTEYAKIVPKKAQGLEAVIELTERPDFPPDFKHLEEFMATLRNREPAVYHSVYNSLQSYAEVRKEEGKYRQEFINSYIGKQRFPRLLAGAAIFPTYISMTCGSFLERITKMPVMCGLGMGMALATEILIAGKISKDYFPLRPVIMAWVFGSHVATFTAMMVYDLKCWFASSKNPSLARSFKQLNRAGEYHRHIAEKLVEYFGFTTGTSQ